MGIAGTYGALLLMQPYVARPDGLAAILAVPALFVCAALLALCCNAIGRRLRAKS
jgi:hypothetical protein